MAEVIVALDLPTAAEAVRLVDRLPGLSWGKIGPMLFLDGGPAVVMEIKQPTGDITPYWMEAIAKVTAGLQA